MKKGFLGLFILGLFFATHTFGYQQQGFSQYTEDQANGTITFSCTKQCILLLGSISEGDIVTLQGNMQGNGLVGYGYLLNNQLYPGTVEEVETNKKYRWDMATDRVYANLPKQGVQVALIFEGTITAQKLSVGMTNKTIGDKRDGFWKVENIAPYSINLHYGPFWGNLPWPKLAGILFIIIAGIVIISKKHTIKTYSKTVIGIAVVLMVLGGVRLVVDNIIVTNQGVQTFAGKEDGRLFDLDDYITVTKKIRNILHLDSIAEWKGKTCTIYTKSFQDWPFNAHRAMLYMRPCMIVPTSAEADYTIFYKVQPTNLEIENHTVLLTGDSFILLKNAK